MRRVNVSEKALTLVVAYYIQYICCTILYILYILKIIILNAKKTRNLQYGCTDIKILIMNLSSVLFYDD